MSDAELCKQIYDTLGTYITANASQAEWMHGAAKWRENVRESIKFQLPQLTPPEPSVEEVIKALMLGLDDHWASLPENQPTISRALELTAKLKEEA